ncbi:MAG: nitrogenase [Clostridium sp.]|uniref:Fe-only nitrogenase accessory AnfO family protein n=1 Tax=Clostridium sp. TaxID=1506 RepID=UPI0025BBA4E4|nr:Fe-only nitrogenase accessory AnfO family protein [Clostridium sp.]MCE5221365.1 nitrogenase [Clostridium sp.]
MNEIAVFLDEKNEISSFTEAKCVNIFAREEDSWKVKKEILVERTSSGKGIKEVREEYINLVKQMDDCKIVIVTKAFGIPYSVFYAEDFSVWELEGNPMNFLNEIIRKEKEQEEAEENKEEIAKNLGEGHYFIDLMELEISNPEMSSKKAIIPYLKEYDVKKIEIHCCHVPPWLVKEKDRGAIELDIKEVKKNDFMVTIEKKN